MNVFVTGATGFVGTYLVEYLNSLGHRIFGTSFPENPKGCKASKMARLLCVNLKSENELYEFILESQPEWIFHLAAISNVRHSWENRKETLETNLIGTFNLFEATRKAVPSARILFISSSDVYGNIPGREKALQEDDDTQIMSPYAYSKLSGEMLCEFYCNIENLNVIIARPFPHTGPGQSPDFVCSDWACQIAKIERDKTDPVLQVGNIDISRDFTDVRDVVRAYVQLAENGKKGQKYNISSGQMVALKEILEYLLSLSTESITIHRDKRKLRKADISKLWGDNQKLKQATNWNPQIPLKQTLQDLLAYWRVQS